MRDLSSLKGDRTHSPSTLEGKVLTAEPPGPSPPPTLKEPCLLCMWADSSIHPLLVSGHWRLERILQG